MDTPKRKAIKKSVRFEIFKRDKFTCQYCGAKAPDVVLHVDHIKPVARGGTNAILNLVTSCVSCNAGKSATPLDDNTAVEKARKQADFFAERKEQIEMLRDWHMGLANQSASEIEAVNSLYTMLTNDKYVIAEHYKPVVAKIIRQFGLDSVLLALRIGTESYKGDASRALDKLGGICAGLKDPSIKRKGWIKGIARNRIVRLVEWQFITLMNRGYKAGADHFLDELEGIILRLDCTWHQFQPDMEELVCEYEEAANES